jgi:GNAT superfamily N-acetyltransferase
VFGDYGVYRIFRSPTTEQSGFQESELGKVQHIGEATVDDLAAADSQLMRDQAWYGGPGAWIFVFRSDSRILGTSIVWFGERYKARNFWPLSCREAKLVQLVVEPTARCQGIGCALIRYSAQAAKKKGFDPCYARVWYSNGPSVYAFRNANWHEIAIVVEVFPLRSTKPWRFTWRK